MGLDDVLSRLEPTTKEDQLRRLRFLSDLCRWNQQSTKFIEGFLAYQARVAERVTPPFTTEQIYITRRQCEVPAWVRLPEIPDLQEQSD